MKNNYSKINNNNNRYIVNKHKINNKLSSIYAASLKCARKFYPFTIIKNSS